MKKLPVFCLILITIIILLSSCSPIPIVSAPPAPEPTAVSSETAAPSPSPTIAPTPEKGGVITVYSYSNQIDELANKYKSLHPDFGYEIYSPLGPMNDAYQAPLDYALTTGGPNAADIYCVEDMFAAKYIQGEMSGYAIPYKDLIPDLDQKIASAQIAPYIVDVGTRPSDNAVVGLAYWSATGAFIYRRSIAKDVWGTDDPAVIASKIGPGWNKFFAAAEDLKQKGYSIVSGEEDIWVPVKYSAEEGWVVDGKLNIDPRRASFLDYAKQLNDNGYTNRSDFWRDEWYADMSDSGERKVFGYFVPACLIDHYIARNSGAAFDEYGILTEVGGTYGDWAVCEPTQKYYWGGTWVLANKALNNNPAKKAAVAELIDWITLQCGKDSLQYLWANGMLSETHKYKDAVASSTVMAMSDGTMDFLGGQNMFDIFIPASQNVNGKNITEYDDAIDTIWRDQVRKYADGKCMRGEAIAAFKQEVKKQLGIDAWY